MKLLKPLLLILSAFAFGVLINKYAVPRLFAQSGDPTIAAAGDISPASRSNQFGTSDVVQWINPNTVLVLGDNQYPDGTLSDYNNYYHPSWGRFKSKTRPVPGNHEYHISGAAGYFDYFNGVGVANGLAGERGKGYYSFNVGSWHMIALNSEVMSSAQNAWLEADLNANNHACVLAFWHHPRFSSGNHGSNTRSAPFWDILYRHRADIVLTGHDHHYERFAPQNPSGAADPNGIRQWVAGMGGAGLYSMRSPIANSQFRNNTNWGVLKMTLHANSYDWQFIKSDTAHTVLDSGSGNCVGGGTAPTASPSPAGATATPSRTPTPQANTTATRTPTRTPTLPPGTTATRTPTPVPGTNPGDVNGDRKVDIFDYNQLITDFGRTGSPGFVPADINRNGSVDIFDYNIILTNFGRQY